MPLPLNQWAFNDDEIISAPAELPVHKNLLRVLVCQGKKNQKIVSSSRPYVFFPMKGTYIGSRTQIAKS